MTALTRAFCSAALAVGVFAPRDTTEEDHPIRDDVGGVALVAVLVVPAARLDVALDRAAGSETDLHLAAEQIGLALRTALIGDAHDVDAGHGFEELRCEM